MAYCPLSKIMHEWCLTAEFDNYHEASGLRALRRTLSYRFEAEELDGKWNCMVCNNERSEVSKRIGRHHAFIIYFKIACESRRLPRSFSARLYCKNLRSSNKTFHRSSWKLTKKNHMRSFIQLNSFPEMSSAQSNVVNNSVSSKLSCTISFKVKFSDKHSKIPCSIFWD